MQLVLQRCCRKAMLHVLPPTFKPVNNIICCKTGLMWVNATAVRKWRKWIHLTTGWRRDEHGTHKHAHGSWTLCSVSRVRSKTMHSVCISHKSYLTLPGLLHYLVLHRFKIHSVSELSRTALLGCRLAASRLREAARWQLLWIANLVVWVQQNTVLICTFYTPSGSSWHSHQTFCLSIPQAGRAKDTKVKGKVTREIGTRKSRTKSVVSSTLTK